MLQIPSILLFSLFLILTLAAIHDSPHLSGLPRNSLIYWCCGRLILPCHQINQYDCTNQLNDFSPQQPVFFDDSTNFYNSLSETLIPHSSLHGYLELDQAYPSTWLEVQANLPLPTLPDNWFLDTLGNLDTIPALPKSDPSPLPTNASRSSNSSSPQTYTCTICHDFIAKRLCDFNKHMKKHIRPVQCRAQCGDLFETKFLEKRHFNSIHAGNDAKVVWHCPHTHCKHSQDAGGTGFTRKDSRDRHIRKMHELKHKSRQPRHIEKNKVIRDPRREVSQQILD